MEYHKNRFHSQKPKNGNQIFVFAGPFWEKNAEKEEKNAEKEEKNVEKEEKSVEKEEKNVEKEEESFEERKSERLRIFGLKRSKLAKKVMEVEGGSWLRLIFSFLSIEPEKEDLELKVDLKLEGLP